MKVSSVIFASALLVSSCGFNSNVKNSNGSDARLLASDSALEDLSKKDWKKHSELTYAPIAKHPQGCNFIQCEISKEYEMALEKEYWRHLQQEDLKGMAEWIKKTKFYVDHPLHKLKVTGRDNPHARLMLLVSLGHAHQLAFVDFEVTAKALSQISSGDVIAILSGVGQVAGRIPLAIDLEESIRWSLKAFKLAEQPQLKDKSLMAMMSVGVSLQSMAPEFFGVTGPKATMATMFGPSCKEMPQWVQNRLGALCTEKGLIGPDYRQCQDPESCKNVGHGITETFAGAVLALSKMHDPSKIEKMLEIAGDTPEAPSYCTTFWCRYLNPEQKNTLQPEVSSLTPFKRVVNLLMIAEAYGKTKKLDRMELVLSEAIKEAKRLNYPFMNQVSYINKALHGGAEGVPDLLKRWHQFDPKKDGIGMFQVPFPPSGTKNPCASCHFGGILPQATLDIYR